MLPAAIKSLRIPTVFDGPGCLNYGRRVPKFFTRRPRNCRVRHCSYWAARLPWSTLTPGPIVLDTEIFFK